MTEPGSPDWWLDRLYKRLRARTPQIKEWDDWYTGAHPVPAGHEDAESLFARVMEAVGLNMLALVTDAALDRMAITGFKVDGRTNDDVWNIWQANNFDLGSEQVRQEKMALSESYVLVDPNGGSPLLTPEHPEQCIVEHVAGSTRTRAAALKVWFDDLGATPLVRAMLQVGAQVYGYAAPTRLYADSRYAMAQRPTWELQPAETGPNSLGEVSLVPFSNRARMLRDPLPEFHPAIPVQKRINKTLLDRVATQDRGSFQAMWATGLKIPRDPVTKKPVEQFIKAIDRMFINENPDGKFGQLDADDISQLLAAVRDDVADCAMVVPTSPDQILGKLVNVSGDGLKLAQVSEVKRVRRHMRHEAEPWEDVARLALKGAGKSVPNAERMTTEWTNPEYRTDTEQANAATVAINAGMPEEVAWERYFNATPDEVRDWAAKRAAQLSQLDPVTAAALAGAGSVGAAGGDSDTGAGA